jgi:hypothetical protein
MAEFKPPEGFTTYSTSSPLRARWLPFRIQKLPDPVHIGVGAREEYCDLRGLVRGEFYGAQNLRTASISLDYSASDRPGHWRLFVTDNATGDRTICFIESDISSDGETAAGGRACFRRLLDRPQDA